MSQYLKNALIAACMVSVAVSFSKSNLEQHDTKRQQTDTHVLCVPDSKWYFKESICDVYKDCSNGQDELDCNEYQCHGYPLIKFNRTQKCDGINDCPGGRFDEDFCQASPGTTTTTDFFCYNAESIPLMWTCDGFPDCDDGSDEENCEEFTCNNGQSIVLSWKCDTFLDCNDGSDEANCEDVLPTTQSTDVIHTTQSTDNIQSTPTTGTGITEFNSCTCTCQNPEYTDVTLKKSFDTKVINGLKKERPVKSNQAMQRKSIRKIFDQLSGTTFWRNRRRPGKLNAKK